MTCATKAYNKLLEGACVREENGKIFEEFASLGMLSSRGLLDYWFATLSNLAWSQEQINTIVNQAVDQGRVSKEDGTKMVEEFISRARDTQQQFQTLITEGVKSTLSALQVPTKVQLEKLRSLVDELISRLGT